GIGIKGGLPWRLKGDMEHFREITVGQGNNGVIMGRTTWLSLPEKFRPLPERVNVVLTEQDLNLPQGVLRASSIGEAINQLETKSLSDIFVIGGGQVYAQGIVHPLCQKLYVTEIMQEFDCDTFFPEIPEHFIKVSESDLKTEGDISYHFAVYEKK
ncbi:MAG TPA: hypothetical protein DDW92_01055, partial [Candidatus Veblenbacteria bacterium]|nr:hypothetical protein [Candidatus Veblenbacteria bacterium]